MKRRLVLQKQLLIVCTTEAVVTDNPTILAFLTLEDPKNSTKYTIGL